MPLDSVKQTIETDVFGNEPASNKTATPPTPGGTGTVTPYGTDTAIPTPTPADDPGLVSDDGMATDDETATDELTPTDDGVLL